MNPWCKMAGPRMGVSAGRSLNPDEFAVRLEQVIAGMIDCQETKTEQERRPDFPRLAKALPAPYSIESEEDDDLDALALVVPR